MKQRTAHYIAENETAFVTDTDGHIYKIERVPDDFAEDPRMLDNTGTMVCWHRRYTLGDEQPKEDPQDWLRALLIAEIEKSGDTADLIRKARESGAIITTDSVAITDREITTEYNSVTDHDFIYDAAWFLTISQMLDAFKKLGWHFLPLFLLDHSGLAVSTEDFNDVWDSAQIGWIYAPPQNENDDRFTDRILKEEVSVYNQYLQGSVFGVEISRFTPETSEYPDEASDGEFEGYESCYGMFSDEDLIGFCGDVLDDPVPWQPPETRAYPKTCTPAFVCPLCGGKLTGKWRGCGRTFTGICESCKTSVTVRKPRKEE